MNKNLFKIAIAIGIIAIIAIGFYFYDLAKHRQSNSEQTNQPLFSVDKKDLIQAAIPKGFPQDLPVESGAEVLQNYEATTNDGRTQSTRITATKKTLTEAVKIYSDFFTKSGWKTISTETPDANTQSSLLLKDGDSLLIVARAGESDHNTIGLTLTQSADTLQK